MKKYFLWGVGCSTVLLGSILVLAVLYFTGASALDEGNLKPQNIDVTTN